MVALVKFFGFTHDNMDIDFSWQRNHTCSNGMVGSETTSVDRIPSSISSVPGAGLVGPHRNPANGNSRKLTAIYLVPYHSEPGLHLNGSTGLFAVVEKAIVVGGPYDNGDDPSFRGAQQSKP